MPVRNLKILIQNASERDSLMTHAEIAKKLRVDKSKISGYLQAMVDYGDLGMKRVGNAKVYFLKGKV
jgi:DNA-binding IclR family transcriptional regulator